jgi:hypothetical protein
MLAQSLAVLDLAQRGRFEEIRDLFTPQLRPIVIPEALRAAWNSAIKECGSVALVGVPVSEAAGPGVTTVKIPVAFERTRTIVMRVTDGGKLMGIQRAAGGAAEPSVAWEPPDYADAGRFDEHEITLGSGPLAVNGTLTLPHGSGPRPGVVLLAGSGPFDRDETIGRNTPFKDLAWGLASYGVAVLRFDKVTYAHRGELK